ncbi:PD-(D/E)XK motif protein [Microbacterium karelineae]|uniref:PD-(D/E)XK motif protein n=1 Tax=Microbacterium karelineae TaxID=2654283 RepID=UPI0012EA534B|nr:PD-(D/E)XK motif protein [Microbacterium karelineae]
MTSAKQFELALAGVDLKTVPLHHGVLSAYALNAHGHPALLVRVPQEFDREVEGTRGIDVHVDPVGSANRFLRFQSESVGLTVMFEAIVDSLLDASNDADRLEVALVHLIRHFEDLRDMFASRDGHLKGDLIRGLYAELAMLLELRDAGLAADAAAAAWQGPYRIAKDFVLARARCIEVKSIRRVNHRIKISSVEQLDPRDDDLRLAVLPIERCAPGDGRGLVDLVREVAEWMDSQPSARAAFAKALAALGFEADDPFYQRYHFEQGDWKWFSVHGNFPRIRPDDVPTAVQNVTHTLDIDQLGDFTSSSHWTLTH